MTPEQKIKWLIIDNYCEGSGASKPKYPCDTIDDIYEDLDDDYLLSDPKNEVRSSGIKTNLPSGRDRYYEKYEVAAKLPDGSWVGWTYWFGGGKHGEPESIDWIQYAYDVDCEEEEKLVVVQTFSRG